MLAFTFQSLLYSCPQFHQVRCMSINQLENLLTNASTTAAWWEKNQQRLKKVMRNKSWMWVATGFAMIGGMAAGFSLALHITTSFAPIESFWGFVGFVLACACIAPLLLSVDVCRHKMRNKWPKHLAPPSSELTLKIFEGDESIDLHQKKDILQRIANHPNPAVKKHTAELPALQYLELPDAWWKAVQNALNVIPNHDASCAVKFAQQQLNEMYVDIQLQSGKKVTPKILKL